VPIAADSDVGASAEDDVNADDDANAGDDACPIKTLLAEEYRAQVPQMAQTSVYPILSSRKQRGNLTGFTTGDIFTKARYYRACYRRIQQRLGGRQFTG
jgi:hypothetical protein